MKQGFSFGFGFGLATFACDSGIYLVLPFLPPPSPPPLSTPAGAERGAFKHSASANWTGGYWRKVATASGSPRFLHRCRRDFAPRQSTSIAATRLAGCLRARHCRSTRLAARKASAHLTSREAAKSAGRRGREDQARGSYDSLREMHVPQTTVETVRAVEAESETRSQMRAPPFRPAGWKGGWGNRGKRKKEWKKEGSAP